MAKSSKYRGRWVVRWRDLRGKQCMRRAPDKATADRLERDIERAIALGRDWEPEVARTPTRLDEALKAYQDEVARVSSSRHTIKRTGETLEYARKLWGPAMPLEQLSKAHLSELWAWLRDPATGRHGNQRSKNTVAKHLTTMQSFWKWCAQEEKFETECPHPRSITLPRDDESLPVAPTWAQCDRMIDALNVEWHRRVAVVARFTGARSSELFALDWRDVDMPGKQIRWRPEITKGGYGGRVVPMPKPLHDELAGWGKREGQVVAATRRGEAHVRDKFRDAWKRAGVPLEVFDGQPLHGFRKTIETELLAGGVRQQVIDVYLGHKAKGTGQKHYADMRWAWQPLLDALELIPEITVPLAAALEVV